MANPENAGPKREAWRLTALDLPDEVGMAYVVGEARTCQAVRDHLVRVRTWPRTRIKVKPFWIPGKNGRHH